MVNAERLTLEDMEDFPYLYFEQDADSPVAFAEEALASVAACKSIAVHRPRVAVRAHRGAQRLHGDERHPRGHLRRRRLNTVPLDTDVQLRLGYVVRKAKSLARSASASWTLSRRTS